MKILIVDDEQDICEVIQFYLSSEGYEVDTANSPKEAFAFALGEYDLILLDVMMDGMSGFEMAKVLRSTPETASVPIIFITAMNSEDSIVQGLDGGGDDYLTKPLSLRELRSRIKSVVRRTKPQPDTAGVVGTTQTMSHGALVVDLETLAVTIDGADVPLTRLELNLLMEFMKHPGKHYGREELISRCWPSDTVVMDRTVDVTVARLRKKLGEYGGHIKSRVGYGYAFVK